MVATGTYRTAAQAATAVAVDWDIKGNDDFYIHAIRIDIDIAPAAAGSFIVTLDSAKGAAYDCILTTADPVTYTTVVIEDVGPFEAGDVVTVTYTNPDTRTVTATALYEI